MKTNPLTKATVTSDYYLNGKLLDKKHSYAFIGTKWILRSRNTGMEYKATIFMVGPQVIMFMGADIFNRHTDAQFSNIPDFFDYVSHNNEFVVRPDGYLSFVKETQGDGQYYIGDKKIAEIINLFGSEWLDVNSKRIYKLCQTRSKEYQFIDIVEGNSLDFKPVKTMDELYNAIESYKKTRFNLEFIG